MKIIIKGEKFDSVELKCVLIVNTKLSEEDYEELMDAIGAIADGDVDNEHGDIHYVPVRELKKLSFKGKGAEMFYKFLMEKIEQIEKFLEPFKGSLDFYINIIDAAENVD